MDGGPFGKLNRNKGVAFLPIPNTSSGSDVIKVKEKSGYPYEWQYRNVHVKQILSIFVYLSRKERAQFELELEGITLD
jgi:hypothetical protein